MMFGAILLGVLVLALVAMGTSDSRARRRTLRRLDEETRARQAEEGRADVEPEAVLRALTELADVVGVEAVYQEKDSNVVHVLVVGWVNEARLRALRDTVRFSTPIGLSARVVRTKEEIPPGCVIVAKAFAA